MTTLKEIIEKMKNRKNNMWNKIEKFKKLEQKDYKNKIEFEEAVIKTLNAQGQFNVLDWILPDLEKANEEQGELIKKLVCLYKINQNINNIIEEYNIKAKEKIGLNVIDLMNEIEIEDFIENITGKNISEKYIKISKEV